MGGEGHGSAGSSSSSGGHSLSVSKVAGLAAWGVVTEKLCLPSLLRACELFVGNSESVVASDIAVVGLVRPSLNQRHQNSTVTVVLSLYPFQNSTVTVVLSLLPIPEQYSDSSTVTVPIPEQYSDSSTVTVPIPEQYSDSSTVTVPIPEQYSDSSTVTVLFWNGLVSLAVTESCTGEWLQPGARSSEDQPSPSFHLSSLHLSTVPLSSPPADAGVLPPGRRAAAAPAGGLEPQGRGRGGRSPGGVAERAGKEEAQGQAAEPVGEQPNPEQYNESCKFLGTSWEQNVQPWKRCKAKLQSQLVSKTGAGNRSTKGEKKKWTIILHL